MDIKLEPKKDDWDCFTNILSNDYAQQPVITRRKLKKEDQIDELDLTEDTNDLDSWD